MNEHIAMKGGGYYSLATLGAKHVIDGATPMVLEAIGHMPKATGPFVFADMGTADGGTSLDLVAAVIEAVRRRWPAREIAIVHTDQPRNDFNALVANVHGRPRVQGVYLLQSATSFYRQILPSGFLDLGFSATAMHWLSAKPCDISNHVQAVGAQGAELEAFARQGNADWREILLHRAAELKPGGRLVLVNFCRDELGRYLGHTGGVNMFDTFNRIWRGLLESGKIGEGEYRAMTLPQYYKTLPEFTDPLTDPNDPVYRAGLRLEKAETRIIPCPFATEFRRTGDAANFAKNFIPTMRSWTESTFLGARDPSRPLAERKAIIDDFYANYEARVRADPADHGMDYVHAYLTIARV
jgi:indole-3-acetate O-methyltransferase